MPKDKRTTEKRGRINLGNKVMVSDPCYGLDTWCQGVVENVLPGEYRCSLEYIDEGDYGVRVASILVLHESYQSHTLYMTEESFRVGVDSGQAGIFDYAYYESYHKHQSKDSHVNESWYGKCCDKTYHMVKNPQYREFRQVVDGKLTTKRRYDLWMFDGGTIGNKGFVASSGWGDGDYTCKTAKNSNGEVVAIFVEFICEAEDEDESDIYEVTCPCGRNIEFDYDTLLDGYIVCPDCGETLELCFDEYSEL